MSVKDTIQSFKHALRGLKHAFVNETNFRIQIVFAFLVIIFMFVFPLQIWEIILLILLIFSVLVMELLNTALEFFSDLLKPRLHHYVFKIKDIMAAAVLLTSVAASIIGLIILLPHFIELFT